MTELGNRLKEARLAKDLSLDDLQSMTKIQKRYLQGIEEGNYSSMPGNFYVRAFIKQYAEALQLNPEEIFETYKSEIPAPYNDDLPDQLSRVKSRKTITRGTSKVLDILPNLLIVLIVVVAAGLVYYFISTHTGSKPNETLNNNATTKMDQSDAYKKAITNNQTGSQKNDQKKQADKAAKEQAQTPPVQVTPPQELSVVSSGGINTTYALKNADKFVVKLVSKGQTWVSVRSAQGKSYFQGMLSAGGASSSQTVDLSAESEATIVVGRTLDTDIFVNDQKLDYAISPTQVVRQNITIQYVPKNK